MRQDPKDIITSSTQGFLYASKSAREGPSWTDYMISQMRQVGFASQNRYLVLIFPNQKIRDNLGLSLTQDVTRLAVMCKSVSIDARAWFTAEEKTLSAGPDRIMPYKRNTANSAGFKLTFHCGADMYEKELFDAWYEQIQNPKTREFSFYDDYAMGSQVYLLLLPNKIQNFEQALAAMQTGRVSGYRLTETYPYSIGIPSLASGGATEPLSVDIGMMFRDVLPIDEVVTPNRVVPAVYDTGFPAFPENKNAEIYAQAATNLQKAYQGHAVGMKEAKELYKARSESEKSIYRQFVDDLWSQDRKIRAQNLPRAIDGRAVYETPRLGGLQLAAVLAQNAGGFFGASLS
jgi:hypothetical protein